MTKEKLFLLIILLIIVIYIIIQLLIINHILYDDNTIYNYIYFKSLV